MIPPACLGASWQLDVKPVVVRFFSAVVTFFGTAFASEAVFSFFVFCADRCAWRSVRRSLAGGVIST